MTQRFSPGDRVRTRAPRSGGHTRLPRYLAGRRGTIEVVHGLYAVPDERARGIEVSRCSREALYTVVFEGDEVWRDRLVERVRLSADLWDSYLEGEG